MHALKYPVAELMVFVAGVSLLNLLFVFLCKPVFMVAGVVGFRPFFVKVATSVAALLVMRYSGWSSDGDLLRLADASVVRSTFLTS